MRPGHPQRSLSHALSSKEFLRISKKYMFVLITNAGAREHDDGKQLLWKN